MIRRLAARAPMRDDRSTVYAYKLYVTAFAAGIDPEDVLIRRALNDQLRGFDVPTISEVFRTLNCVAARGRAA
jgi:hypothetical protein